MEGLLITSYYGCTCNENTFEVLMYDNSGYNENPIYCKLTCFSCRKEYIVDDVTEPLTYAGLVQNDTGMLDESTVEKIKIKMKNTRN